jgi:hypothetical protein
MPRLSFFVTVLRLHFVINHALIRGNLFVSQIVKTIAPCHQFISLQVIQSRRLLNQCFQSLLIQQFAAPFVQCRIFQSRRF